jgi:dihydroflavonol-4-reductase
MTRVFVTGASGFIGGALTTRLLERGDEVVGLARSDAAAAKVAARGAEVARGDLLDEESMASGMAGCDSVYHVAGVNSHCPPDPDMQLRVNVGGAAAAVRAAARAGIGRMVYTSSAASLGEPAGTVGTEDCTHRGSYLSVYDRSKHEGEQAVFAVAEETGVEVVAVNPSSVQGPPRTGGNGAIIIAYLNGKLPAFVETQVSIVDVQDCVEGHLLAAERGEPGRRYVLNGATVSSVQAMELVSELSGVRDRVRMIPPTIARAAVAIAESAYRARGKTPSICRARVRTILHGHRYDGSRATRELGLEYTPLRDTFARTIEWAVAEGLVRRPLPGIRRPRGGDGVSASTQPPRPGTRLRGSG